MEPLLAFPDPVPPDVAQGLDLGGYPWKAVSSPEAAARLEPEDGGAGAVVSAEIDPEAAFTLCRTLRKRDIPMEPVLLVISPSQLADHELREDLFEDFVLAPVTTTEIDARLNSPAIPARCSRARRCSRGCGATTTTAAPAPSTSTSGACGPSSARSTPT
jgi:hypothetical protein